jgi:hypothetical protein
MPSLRPLCAPVALLGTGRHLLVLATLSIPALYAEDDAPPTSDEAPTPRLVITEFLPTTVGSDAGHEWIEIANAGLGDASLAGLQLIDGQLQTLYTFADDAKLPAGHTGLVFLGPHRPGVAEWLELTPELAVFFSGHAPEDLLGDAAGGLALCDADGAIVDAVIYGTDDTATLEPLFQLAQDAGTWSDGYVDVSFSSPSPSHADGSIGRSHYAVDTDGPADFAGDGGPDGAGSSPGAPNTVDVMGFNKLLFHAQEVANSAFYAYSNTTQQLGRFQVVSSELNLIQPEDLPGLAYEVTALHTFDVIDALGGPAPVKWTGMLTARFEPLDDRGYRAIVEGELVADSDNFLELVSEITLDRFGTPSRRDVQDNAWALTLDGQRYPISVHAEKLTRLVSASRTSFESHRQATLWDGVAPQSASLVLIQDRLGEDSYQETWTSSSPNPVLPAYLGAAVPQLGTLTRHGSAQRTGVTADQPGTLKYQRFDTFLGKQLVSRLADGSPANFAIERASGIQGDLLGTFTQALQLPIVPVSPSGSTGPQIDYGMQVIETSSLNDGKLVARSQGLWTRNGSPLGTIARFVDPPLALLQVTIGKPPVTTQLPTTYGNGTAGGRGWGPDWDAGTGVSVAAAVFCLYAAPTGFGAAVCVTIAILAADY